MLVWVADSEWWEEWWIGHNLGQQTVDKIKVEMVVGELEVATVLLEEMVGNLSKAAELRLVVDPLQLVQIQVLELSKAEEFKLEVTELVILKLLQKYINITVKI